MREVLAMRPSKRRRWSGWVLSWLLAVSAQASVTVAELPESVFARVGEDTITTDEFKQFFHNYVRNRFYHGKIPDDERTRIRREAAKELIGKVLLVQEARRRGYRPQSERIETTLAGMLDAYRQRYGKREDWPEYREKLAQRLRTFLENQSLLIQLKADLAKIPDPDEATVRRYYETHPDKFTSPEQLRVAVILLRVAPSSTPAVWEQAMEEGRRIRKQLDEGADFAELARLHSADDSAEEGGDMGYLHRGMLAKPVQDALDGLQPGEITPPLRLLQGVAIFRLEDRKPPVRNPFEKVRARARELYLREARQQRIDELLARLWETTPIQINGRYGTLASDGPARTEGTSGNDSKP